MPVAAKKIAPAKTVSGAPPVEAVVAAVEAVLPSTSEAAAPVVEIQQSIRTALEKGVIESRAAFAKAKTAADETAGAIELSFAAAKDGALAINAKAFESLRANADANFDFLKAVFAAKSLSDVVTLQTEFARKQVETVASQTKDFRALTQKAIVDSVEPIKEQVAKSFKIAV
jgi:phasin